MKLHGAIEQFTIGKWFRPESLDGTGMAYTIKDRSVYLVPTSKGGDVGMTYDAELLSWEWVIIDINDVINERN